jgi:putative peptide zinc metalloprotease protein
MGNAHEYSLRTDVQEVMVDIPVEEHQDLWDQLEEKTADSLLCPRGEEPGGRFDLWKSLQQRIDLSRRRPKRITGYEVAHLAIGSDHEYYVLKNPTASNYLKCTPQDFFLWEMMDSQHTVRDMAVAYFTEFGSFPFERVVRLIDQLSEAGFLEEKPLRVFNALGQRIKDCPWAQRLNRWADALMHHEFRIRNPDAFFAGLYRRGGWAFFGRAARALYIPLTLVGVILFLREYYTGVYPLLKAGESYGQGLLLLLLISFLVAPIHECAHALACKYYGREVLGTGATLYYGSLAFFVDTNDVWLAPKRARIAVSWAGPFSTILIASVCSTIVTLLPEWSVSPFLFQVSFMCYYSGLMNLNPLLELDGYYILMDFLGIPRLRQKALGFVKEDLPKRLFQDWRTFSQEELIFSVFGLLSALWTAIVLVLGLRFVHSNLLIMLRELRTSQDPLSITVLGIVVLTYGLPRVGGLALKAAAGVAAGAKNLCGRISTG